jgi:putative oxidoreductase
MQLSTYLPSFISTTDSLASTLLRLALGVMILPHGLQKTLGWFGGYGFKGTMGYLTGAVGAPWLFAFLAILAETVGAVMLIAGAGTRFAAAAVTAVMVVAATQHWQNGFFMNWTGAQKGEGFEFHLLAITIGVALVILGGGRYSVDSLLSR